MIENTLRGSYRDVELYHVRMSFSRELSETGRISPRKLLHVVGVVVSIAAIRVRRRATVLYYPPAGDDRLPLCRDVAILCATRWMFDTSIFHFHAGGVSEAWTHLPKWARPFFRWAYFHPDVGIRTSCLAPQDPERLHATMEFVIPNGVEDVATGQFARVAPESGTGIPSVLFVGLLRESKGVLVLLDACAQLRQRGVPFRLDLVGEFHTPEFKETVAGYLRRSDLEGVVKHHGVLVGEGKHRAYAGASVLAFPTFFESETFGIVLIEAMQFSIPVVATSWRGIPSVVEDGGNGYLVPVRDSGALADRLAELLTEPALRWRLGGRGRELYQDRYTLAAFHSHMQDVFDFVRRPGAPV